jgi:hypothetical protein
VILYKQDSLHLSPSRASLVIPRTKTIYQLWRRRYRRLRCSRVLRLPRPSVHPASP